MTRWISLFLLLLTRATMGCPDRAVTHLHGATFDSELSALQTLADEVLDDSTANDVEFGGAIYRLGEGDVRVSVGRGCPGADTITFSVRPLEGRAASAYWHTHGADGDRRDLFSADDARVVMTEQRPFYLITPRGEIRVLDPTTLQGRPWRAESKRVTARRAPLQFRGKRVQGAR